MLGLILRFQNEINFIKDVDVTSTIVRLHKNFNFKETSLDFLDIHELDIFKKIKYFNKNSKCLVKEDFQLCSVYLDEDEIIHLGFELSYGDYPSEEIVFRAN